MKRMLTVAAILTTLVCSSARASADVPNPLVIGPITGGTHGYAFGALSSTDLARAHYIENEYFIEGIATSYAKVGTWTTDGVWPVLPASSTYYKVRMLVRRPANAKHLNGVVVVEWLNVTALAEGAADFFHMQEEILREGYVWVGVGAQASGVNAPGSGLKAWDPARYGTLVHPGDRYSYDIFSQATQALRHPNGLNPLGLRASREQEDRDRQAGDDLDKEHQHDGEHDREHERDSVPTVLATGRSQSAFRLVTYINAIHPLAHLFDGFLVHSRGRNAAGLTAEQLAADPVPIPTGAHIRLDTDVPILDVQTEGDMTALRSHLTRQPPNDHYRRWEIAGAAHAETPRWVVEVPPPLDFGPGCLFAVNAAPHHAVVKAALRALAEWVTEGEVPPQSPEIELANPTAVPAAIIRDAFGNAKGGIRLPELEAPTATLDGRINVAAPPPPPLNFCSLFGGTVPFDQATLQALYPDHRAFVRRFDAATNALVRQGYWLSEEAREARRAAAQSGIGK